LQLAAPQLVDEFVLLQCLRFHSIQPGISHERVSQLIDIDTLLLEDLDSQSVHSDGIGQLQLVLPFALVSVELLVQVFKRTLSEVVEHIRPTRVGRLFRLLRHTS
jgi:uncharacterized membrane protein